MKRKTRPHDNEDGFFCFKPTDSVFFWVEQNYKVKLELLQNE